MKRRIAWHRILIACVVAALVVSAHDSDATVQCLKPCEKVPCLYVRQILMKIMLGDLYKNKKLRVAAMAIATSKLSKSATLTEISHLAADVLYDLIQKIVADPATQQKLPGCADSKLDDPPGFETDADCKIFMIDPVTQKPLIDPATGKPLSDRSKLNTCEEFLDASQRHEEVHQDECELARASPTVRTGPPRDRQDVDTFADEEAAGYDREVYWLRRLRDSNRKRCTRPKPQKSEASPKPPEAQSLATAASSLTALGVTL